MLSFVVHASRPQLTAYVHVGRLDQCTGISAVTKNSWRKSAH